MPDIGSNWARVRAAIAAAARRAGRDPSSVRVIAASKTKSPAVIRAAIAAGIRDFGENYVQEAADKIAQIGEPAAWHMIGHLQRNKAARAVELFETIQSVDSVALGRALARHGERRGRPVRILVEVNLGGESSKSGLHAEHVAGLLAVLGTEQGLSIDGLMTIPPPGPAEVARRFFCELRCLRDTLWEKAPGNAPLRELSMGMTDDFEVAVEEGATMVRIGRALLGERPARPSGAELPTEER
jgi:pyridoxal phosphate enzyme (YggS family)